MVRDQRDGDALAARDSGRSRGYLEVETPVLQTVHGGAAARPFHTHLNAFDQQMSLRIATRALPQASIVGGVDRVYEIGRTSATRASTRRTAPEFTMLEAYEAYGDYHTMAELDRSTHSGLRPTAGLRTPRHRRRHRRST